MKENFKLFVHLLYVLLFRKKVKRERLEAEAKAAKIIENKFLANTKDLANEFTQMHKACKTSNPVNYIQKMQPYFVRLNNYMKANNCDPIEAAMGLVTTKTKKSEIIWIYGTAAEMINNLKPEDAKAVKSN